MPTRSWMTYYETEVQPVNVLCDIALRLLTLTLIVLVSYVRSRLTMKTWWHGVSTGRQVHFLSDLSRRSHRIPSATSRDHKDTSLYQSSCHGCSAFTLMVFLGATV